MDLNTSLITLSLKKDKNPFGDDSRILVVGGLAFDLHLFILGKDLHDGSTVKLPDIFCWIITSLAGCSYDFRNTKVMGPNLG